jgi:hypothetical protein
VEDRQRQRCPILRKIILQKFQQLDLFLSLYPVVLMVGLHSKFGKLTMDEILSPTIAYAEEGFQSELVAYYLEGSVSRYEAVSKR